MSEESQETPGSGYRDRRVGLIFFGLVEILMGTFKLMSLAMMLLLVPLLGRTGVEAEAGMSARTGLFGMVQNLTMGVGWIWLGIGSIMARRWARALVLAYSWLWLLMGVMGMVFMAMAMPGIQERMQSASGTEEAFTSIIVMGFVWIMVGFFMLVLPLIFILFYQSQHVKATCEQRDPYTRWTDRCPLPVLGISLWSLYCALMFLASAAVIGAVPAFGTYLRGIPGILALFLLGALWVWQAWGLYRLDLNTWRGSLALTVLFTVSSLVTFSKGDLLEVYSLMELSEKELEMIRTSGLLEGNTFALIMTIPALFWIGYLVFVRRYFGDPGNMSASSRNATPATG